MTDEEIHGIRQQLIAKGIIRTPPKPTGPRVVISESGVRVHWSKISSYSMQPGFGDGKTYLAARVKGEIDTPLYQVIDSDEYERIASYIDTFDCNVLDLRLKGWEK